MLARLAPCRSPSCAALGGGVGIDGSGEGGDVGYKPVSSEACEGNVQGDALYELAYQTSLRASASRVGVLTLVLPYTPTRSARSVSSEIRMTEFADAGWRATSMGSPHTACSKTSCGPATNVLSSKSSVPLRSVPLRSISSSTHPVVSSSRLGRSVHWLALPRCSTTSNRTVPRCSSSRESPIERRSDGFGGVTSSATT